MSFENANWNQASSNRYAIHEKTREKFVEEVNNFLATPPLWAMKCVEMIRMSFKTFPKEELIIESFSPTALCDDIFIRFNCKKDDYKLNVTKFKIIRCARETLEKPFYKGSIVD
jgi:hypothetical protein